MFKLYKKLFKYVPERKTFAYGSMLLAAISTICLMASYWYLWDLFCELLVTKDYSAAIKDSKLIVIYMVSYGVIYFVALMVSHMLGFRLETNIRKTGLKNLINASFAFFDTNPSGKVRKIIDDNAGETHSTVAHLIPDNVVAGMLPILMFIMTFAVDYRLGILLAITIVVGIFQYKSMYGGEEFMMAYYNSLEKMSSEIIEYVRGMQVLKIFGITVRSYKSLLDAILQYSKNTYEYSLSCRKPYVSFQTLFNTYYLICIPCSMYFITKGEQAGMILAKVIFFTCFSGVIFSSFIKVMFASQNNFNAGQVIDRLENLIDGMKNEKLEHGERKEFKHYDIEFDRVFFKYDEKYIIENLSFKLDEGKTFALVGPSGSGKSTIAKLISGFYSLNSGSIKIGGYDIREYSEETLLQNISFVFQNSKLFKASIYENVKMGDQNATREEIMNALHLAKCESILAKFPEKENTIIGSKGVHLSGGEVQRVAIARAILKKSKIIILDEASAAADPENEYELQQAFSNLMKGKTTIMIAHRLSSIRNVDEILFIENGKVIERGNDTNLMNLNGRYRELQNLYEKANDWRVM